MATVGGMVMPHMTPTAQRKTNSAQTATKWVTSHAAVGAKLQKGKQTKAGKQKQVQRQGRGTSGGTADASEGIFGTVQLDQMGLTMPFTFYAELDSGSQCTTITHSMFTRSFPHDTLQQPTHTLHNFDGSLITCVQGFFLSHTHFRSCMQGVEVYVLDDTCEPVIGQDMMISLEMQVDCGAKQVRRANDDSKVGGLMEGSSYSRAGQMLDVAFPPTRYGGTSSSVVPPLVSSFLAHNPELTSKDIGSNTTSS